MKKLFLLFCFIFSSFLYAQDNPTPCITQVRPDTSSIPKYLRPGWGQTYTAQVVVVYVDFPDGRYLDNNNELKQPLNLSQLSLVTNKDAAGEVGLSNEYNQFYVVGFNTTTQQDLYLKPVKYTWNDRWNMFFSSNGSYNGTVHPDYSSNGDLAYGSFGEYWNEVSNSKYLIEPALTHPNAPTYELQRGILNDYIDMGNGRYVIDYLTLPLNKYGIDSTVAYFPNGNVYSFWPNQYWNKDVGRIQAMQYDCIQAVKNKFPDFGIDNFMSNGGSVIFITAGGHYRFKGMGGSSGHYTLVRGRSDTIDCANSRIDGFGVTAHEFAHIAPNLAWGHSNAGRYCIMNVYDVHDKNCPQHPSPLLKIQEGWITPIPLENSQTSATIPPVETTHQYGIVTIYGKPTANANITTGEYYVLENRRFLGFDRKIIASPPNEFKGGLLVWHYSPYNRVCPKTIDCENSNIQLRAPNPLYTLGDSINLISTTGSSDHFFAWKSELDPYFYYYDSNRTYSSFHLKTGLALSNISNDYNNYSGNITLDINYKICDPPNYSYVMYSDGSSNQTYNLSGFVYVHESNPLNKYIFNGGTTIESPDRMVCLSSVKLLGSKFNHVNINGAGYDNYRTKTGFSVSPLSVLGLSDSVIIKYCDLNNSSSSNYISPGLYNNNISIENFNVLDTSVIYSLNGDLNNPPHLSKYNNNNIPKIHISSKWYFDMDNDFLIPTNSYFQNIDRCEYSPDPTNIVFSPLTQSIILCYGKMNIISDFNCNRDINVQNSGEIGFYSCSSRPYGPIIKFSNNAGIVCSGKFTAQSYYPNNSPKLIIFDKSDLTGYWKGISLINPINAYINGIELKYAETGVSSTYGNSNAINILNSNFLYNEFADIKLDNMIVSDAPGNISHNNFYGTSSQIFSVGMADVSTMNIDHNIFNDVYSTGLNLSNCSNPIVSENEFYGHTGLLATPLAGIYCYNSYGFFGCNLSTNFYDGVLLDNSSPYLLNNEIYNNGYGLYLTNNSNPILSPSYSQNQSLYNAGYNKIYNNLNDEIYCNNLVSRQLSLPYLYNGYNSIYDENNNGYLINVNYNLSPSLDAQNNFWNDIPNDGMFNPQGSVNYSNYLTEPVTYSSCSPYIENNDNSNLPQSVLLLGSANINEYNKNYESASNNYIQCINNSNNISKDQLIISKLFNTHVKSDSNFTELRNYLINLANQHITDTALNKFSTFLSIGSYVEQSLYQQAINEYQNIINNSQNPFEVYYANIEKLRAVRLMLDTLLNPGGGDSPVYYSSEQFANMINGSIISNKSNSNNVLINSNSKSEISGNNKNKNNNIKEVDNNREINKISQNDIGGLKQKNINTIKNLLIPKNINFSNLPNHNLVVIFENVIASNLLEQSLICYTPSERPLNKVKSKYLGKNNKIESINLPKEYKLSQNYPNPFNPVTKINFDLPKEGNVKLVIYDILGREVKQLVNEFKKAGKYTVEFNGNNLASGIYFYRIEIGNFVQVKKMMLIK